MAFKLFPFAFQYHRPKLWVIIEDEEGSFSESLEIRETHRDFPEAGQFVVHPFGDRVREPFAVGLAEGHAVCDLIRPMPVGSADGVQQR